jgi:hypothetical protein
MAECLNKLDETAEPEENCANCRFHAFIDGSSTCRRYPEYRSVPPAHWCGEFQLTHSLLKVLMNRRFSQLDEIRARRDAENRNKPYAGFQPADDDIVINGYRLFCTCHACPEQYDVFDDKTQKQVGYLRLRHGHFRADFPNCGGETVYEADTIGDGCFEDDEKMPQLQKAIEAIAQYLKNHG